MTGRDLGAKVSSLFDVVALHRPLKNAGSSVISYACDPRHDEDVGLHRAKKVLFLSLILNCERITKYLIIHKEKMHHFEEEKKGRFSLTNFGYQNIQKNNNSTLT